ncbi:MAG: hypothetical protein ACLUJR_01395 [Mediterraneibacter gnavus]
MDFEGFELLFCVAAFGWIVYMAFKQKMHKMDPESFKFLALIFGGLLLAFICFLIPGGAKYTFVLIGVTIGGMITMIFYHNIKSVNICNEEIMGSIKAIIRIQVKQYQAMLLFLNTSTTEKHMSASVLTHIALRN